MRLLFTIVLILGGLLMVRRGGTDPREWPDVLREEFARMGEHAKAAAAAGRRAADQREAEIDREMREAMEQSRPE